jgi:hypothetical protein
MSATERGDGRPDRAKIDALVDYARAAGLEPHDEGDGMERKKKPDGAPKPWDYLGWQGDQPTIDDLPYGLTGDAGEVERLRRQLAGAVEEAEKLRARVADLTDERDGLIEELLRAEEDRDEARAAGGGQ